MERAAFLAAWREKKLRGLFMAAVGQLGQRRQARHRSIYSKRSYAFLPIVKYRTLRGGPRVAEHMLNTMPLVPFPTPRGHEDEGSLRSLAPVL
jgi:hypothetical protein